MIATAISLAARISCAVTVTQGHNRVVLKMIGCVFSLRQPLSERRGSNPRPRPWQGRALPTELLSHIRFALATLDETDKTNPEGTTGFEPASSLWKSEVLGLYTTFPGEWAGYKSAAG